MERSKKKILIADDDPAILDVLSLFLEDVGYEVETTDDGAMIQEAQRDHPDLMLLDLDVWLERTRYLCSFEKPGVNATHSHYSRLCQS